MKRTVLASTLTALTLAGALAGPARRRRRMAFTPATPLASMSGIVRAWTMAGTWRPPTPARPAHTPIPAR